MTKDNEISIVSRGTMKTANDLIDQVIERKDAGAVVQEVPRKDKPEAEEVVEIRDAKTLIGNFPKERSSKRRK